MNNTIEPEIIVEDVQLAAVVQQNALPPAVAQSLQASFSPLFASARSIMEKSKGIVVTDAAQKLEIKLARECRLALREVRVNGDKVRKELKDQSLREGRAIDGFQNILLHLTETEEKRLDEQEKFAEVQETRRKEELKRQRTEILLSIQADPALYQLGEMAEQTFQQLVEGVKLARAAAAERARKEEADRIAREAAELAERERVRLENERLRKEAEEKATAEKLERERRNNLHAERRIIMQSFVASGDESANGFYGDMTDEQFGEAKAGAENRREARVKAEQARAALEAAAAEERRKAAEAAETARKEREAIEARAAEEKRQADAILAEQKRKADETAAAIKREADEKARKAKAEADKRAAALKEENDRIQAELKKERDAQAKRAADAAEAAEAERKAAAASAKDKLLNYANAIRAIEIPTDAQAIATVIKASRDKFCDWVEEKAAGL